MKATSEPIYRSPVAFGKNILLLVPHPDDEVVACCATLGRAQQQGSTISALYLTHGCLARETLWPWQRKHYDGYVKRRREEAEQVASLLKLKPVGWSGRAARELWPELQAVHREIADVLARGKYDQVWLPAYEGGNPDHDGLNAIGQRLKHDVSVIEFAEYNFLHGKAQAQRFPFPNGTEQNTLLTADEQALKRAALALYVSEQQNLDYVGVAQECYRPLASYDYAQPPHPETLWYARFQWVPFRHPRVDFSKPEAVSAAIQNFLGDAAAAPRAFPDSMGSHPDARKYSSSM